MAKIKMDYLSFLCRDKTIERIENYFLFFLKRNVHGNFLNGIITKKNHDFEINFSLENYPSKFFPYERIEVEMKIKVEGSKNLEIIMRTPYSFGISLYKEKLNQDIKKALNETLNYQDFKDPFTEEERVFEKSIQKIDKLIATEKAKLLTTENVLAN